VVFNAGGGAIIAMITADTGGTIRNFYHEATDFGGDEFILDLCASALACW